MAAGYKLASYESPQGPRGGLIVGERVYELGAALAGTPVKVATTLDLLERWDEARPVLAKLAAGRIDAPSQAVAETRLLPPVLYPRGLFCAGANYTDHLEEMRRVMNMPDDGGRKEGDLPWHFVGLPAHSMIGHNASFRMPAYASKIDWEAEIAIVIGRRAKDVPVAAAMDYVAGLTILHDLSARDWVARQSIPVQSPFRWDWVSQKCFDESKPIGPWIVPLEDIPDPKNLAIRLWVNDELMQDSNSGKMVFDMAEQIAHLSSRFTLLPGDVIATGTPAGVGFARGRFVQPGDVLKIEVEHVGVLTNVAQE